MLPDQSRVGASVGIAAGLAIATLVLPQVASALNPTGWGTVAVTLLLALVGAIGQRWQSSRRSDSETDAADTGAKSPRQTLRGDRTLAFEIGAMVIVATLLVGVYFVFPHFLHKPKSVEDQINVKLRQFLNGGQDHVVVNERLQLHSGDDPSWVVVIENARNGSDFDIDTKAGRPPHSPNPVSDELRIYDVNSGWLDLKLDYRPRGGGLNARRWMTPAGAPSSLDYNGDGFAEILAGYAIPDAWQELLPFVVDWDGDEYRLVAMTVQRPTLAPLYAGGDPNEVKNLRRVRRSYLTRVSLPNVAHGGTGVTPLQGYQVETFALVDSQPAIRLLTGYFARDPASAMARSLELHSNQISPSDFHLSECTERNAYCPAPQTPPYITIPAARSLDNGLLDSWAQVNQHFATPDCVRREPSTAECPTGPKSS